jgi:Cell division protein 48 (CDC48), domain 2
MGQIIHLVVVSTNPSRGAFLITNNTEIAISEDAAGAIAKDIRS